MVDEFMVCVDRLIQSTSTVPTTDGGGNGGGFEGRVGSGGEEMGGVEGNGGCCSMKSNRKKEDEGRECRICQEEGAESDMEAPCACNGTLKFAHRKCIQKWCNKKGDITCEICNQVYAPNYSMPPRRSTSDSLAIDIRQSWGQHLDFHNPRLLALASAEQVFLSATAEFDDYSTAHNNGIACCRSVALVLMLLLLIRHAFTVTRVSIAEFASAFFNVLWILSLFISTFLVSLLQLAGVLLPCYVIVRTCYLVQSRSQRQAYLRQAWG